MGWLEWQGVTETAGLKGYLTLDLSPGFGYAGIAVAMLANLNPIGVIFSGVFLASIYVGADAMSRAMNVPTYLADVIVALTVLCILLSLVFVHYKILFFTKKRMIEFIEIIFTAGFWAATIRIACPLILATIGEVLCERAGVLNLGIEGIMSIGAMVGWMTVFLGADLYTGILAALVIGGIFGLLHAIFTVYLGASQHVTGIGITMLASSLGFFASSSFCLLLPLPQKIKPFQPIDIPFLSELPFLGPAFFQHTPFTYLALLVVIFAFWLMNSTPLGLSIKMAGENPMALEAQGIDVFLVRTIAVVLGSALMAVGGAYLTLSAFDAFYFGMINGRGWIAIALVIFAS